MIDFGVCSVQRTLSSYCFMQAKKTSLCYVQLGFFIGCQLSRLILQSVENNNNHCGLELKQPCFKVIDN